MAEAVIGSSNVPPWDNSAMDGYAVQAISVSGASEVEPKVLRVIETVAAGDLPQQVITLGTAARIMTGAPIPAGADSVVPFEDTDENESQISDGLLSEIKVYRGPPSLANVRLAGQDVQKGQVVIEKGTVLRSAEIGLLASLGQDKIRVVRRPVLGILATGDELQVPGEKHLPGKIYDSNSYCLYAAALSAGAIPRMLGIAGDDSDSIYSKLRDGLPLDMIVTSAGVSKGDYDLVKDVLSKHGRIEVRSVRMRPAKPLAFGVIDGLGSKAVPHLGLPGNPVSALVAFEQFGRPAICKMNGRKNSTRPVIEAILEDTIYNPDGRRVYARVVVTKRRGSYYARLTGSQDSNILTSMVRANGLAICPEDLPSKDAGEKVKVQMFDWPDRVF